MLIGHFYSHFCKVLSSLFAHFSIGSTGSYLFVSVLFISWMLVFIVLALTLKGDSRIVE